MKKQKEEELEKKGSQAKPESCGEKPEADSDRKSCRKEEQHAGEHEKCSGKAECKELNEKVEALEKEKKDVEAKLAREKDDYIRLMAEFETFRRRTAEEKLALVSSAASETIKGMLPVLDDCERAMELLKTSSDEAAKEGTGLIYDKLMKYLKSKGLEKIEAKGQKFDTDFHEAVAQVPVEDKDKKGLVYDVIETGYTLGGKILRYAKVVVGI